MTFEEVLERDGKLVYTNKGVSMMPLLRQDQDLLVIEKCNPTSLKNTMLFYLFARIKRKIMFYIAF